MKSFCFTIDDNIKFFKEISAQKCSSIFMHPYLAMLKRLHEKYALKIQLNLFYRCDGFTLSDFDERYKSEWEENADWLKLSFHSEFENVRPYEFSEYEEVFYDCKRVNEEILRFASNKSLAKTTTVHYCLLTEGGIRAMKKNGISGLLGLYGTKEKPESSYQSTELEGDMIRSGKTVKSGDISYSAIDIVLNNYGEREILSRLNGLLGRDLIKVMIHEQYFYEDYTSYQPDFEKKLDATFKYLTKNGYKSIFFEDSL